ncbi:MAG: hypothetical protein Q8Q01_00780 [archaeon]|nr:hypothetical protein [archaeon]
MATIQDKMTEIENLTDYVKNSLIIHSLDKKGVVLKWLVDNQGVAERKKIFIELSITDSDIALESRTTGKIIDIEPPGD